MTNLSVIDICKNNLHAVSLPKRDVEFLQIIQYLNPSQCQTLIDLALRLTGSWWVNDVSRNPTERTILTIRHRIPVEYRQVSTDEYMSGDMVNVWRSRSSRLPNTVLQDVSRRLGVSLHWLAMLPDDVLLYTKSVLQEQLYDTFKLLPNHASNIIFDITSLIGGKNHD